MEAAELIRRHGLQPNPHGGRYRQTYACATTRDGRPIATVIHYLLSAGDASCRPHRIGADCIHFFHEGGPVAVRTVDPGGRVRHEVLGPDPAAGQELQVVVPGGRWKELSLLEGGCAFLSEAVVPGYIPEDDEVGDPPELRAGTGAGRAGPPPPAPRRPAVSLAAALDLRSNVEGGYYRQTYESAGEVQTSRGPRPLANTIHYLLTADSPVGHLHRNRSDITHFLEAGGPVEYLLVSPEGRLEKVTMGRNPDRGEVPSFTCPGGWWKSSHLPAGVAEGLVGEITTPGFRVADHEMADLVGFGNRFPDLVEAFQSFIAS